MSYNVVLKLWKEKLKMSLPKRPYSLRGKKEECVGHPLYLTWHNMMQRCYNEKNKGYKNYGDRGITVCEDWHYFKQFLIDMGDKPTQHHSLDRSDNSLGYSKYNCRWATRSEQCDNRRTFKNNTSGERGVERTNFGYKARYTYEKTHYSIGVFLTYDEAVSARRAFVSMFHNDKKQAIKSISEETVWNNSQTKVRGITPHVDGGFIVRTTVDGKRYYVGIVQTIPEGELLRKTFIEDCKIDKELAILKLKIEKPRSTSKTKTVGIHPSGDGFIARANIDGKRCYVGCFKTLNEATDARLKYIAERTCGS